MKLWKKFVAVAMDLTSCITFNSYHFHYLKVLLGIIFKNENKSEEMLDILKLGKQGTEIKVQQHSHCWAWSQCHWGCTEFLYTRGEVRGHTHGNCCLAHCCHLLECKKITFSIAAGKIGSLSCLLNCPQASTEIQFVLCVIAKNVFSYNILFGGKFTKTLAETMQFLDTLNKDRFVFPKNCWFLAYRPRTSNK